MTEKFYCAFLDYLSAKEKQTLCGNLQKRNVRIKGFRLNKDIPSKVLAKHITKNETSFFKILKESYKPTYTDRNVAREAFSPDTAVVGLTYFVHENIFDEEFLISLLQKPVSSSDNQKVSISDTKTQKKYEEFRQKYLAAHKELEQVKKELEEEKKENQRLNELLSVHATETEKLRTESRNSNIDYREFQQNRIELERVRKENQELTTSLSEKETMLLDLCAEIEAKYREYDNTIIGLSQHILELESKGLVSERVASRTERRILVLVPSEKDSIQGTVSLAFDQIPKLGELHKDYTEILFTSNDMPFGMKRYLHKMTDIHDKLRTFATRAELVEYIGKG